MRYIVTPAASRRRDDLVVAHRATGLDDRAHTGVEQHLKPVREREERIGRRHGARARSLGPARITASLALSTRLT